MRVPLLLLAVGALVVAGCLGGNGTPTPTTGPGSSSSTFDANQTLVTIQTAKGTFSFRMFPEAAPKTVAHIQGLVARGFYDGLPFHRYEAGFVLQGGDPDCKGNVGGPGCGSGGSGGSVPLETHPDYKHDHGAVGLARSPAPDSGDSQFYFILGPNGSHGLDGRYCVFGKVESGMDVVLALRAGDVMQRVTLS